MSGNQKESGHARLLDDIEAFSRNGPPLKDEPAVPSITRQRLTFPDLNQPPPEKSPTAAIPFAAAAETAASPANGAGLLARLRHQAQSVRREAALTGAEGAARARHLSACLGAAFHYLDDLVKQLNIVKPAIPKEFIFPGNIVFAGMQWVEGAADFRMVPSATEDRLYENLHVRLRVAAPRQIRVERDALGAEPLRKLLHDYNIAFQLEETRNGRNLVERAFFTLPCEIRAGFLLKADYEAGNVILRTRNIDRFGMMEFRLRVEQLNQEMLDELARLMLGEESRFLKLFRRSA